MRIIEIIRNKVKKEGLDPNFKTIFNVGDDPELKKIPEDVYKNIVVSIHHFETMEALFNDWEKEFKSKKMIEPPYPDINLQPPKDDIVQYSDSW